MAVVINTNVDSIKIQNCLSSATNKMASTMARMSTGLKVNSAKDDAAGCVIAKKMEVQLDGNKIAQNNVQNASALLSTAEGNLDVIQDNLTRIRDLTLQAKNGTYSTEEKQAMQDEVKERIAEIDRISSSSKYSSLQLFGEAGGLAKNGALFQVGSNSASDNTIRVDSSLFKSVTFSALTGINSSLKYSTDKLTKTTADVADGTYSYVKCEETDPDAIALYETNTAGEVEPGTSPIYVKKMLTTDVTALGIDTDDIALNKDSTTEYRIGTVEAGLDLTTLDNMGFVTAINDLDDAINNITNRKSLIGSAGNRLDSALATLTTQYENLSSAKSIITDADIAQEASKYTQESILQQVSTSLLAQANQAPSIALSLV